MGKMIKVPMGKDAITNRVDELMEASLSDFGREELAQLLEEAQNLYEQLEEQEPDTDEESAEYGEWLNLLEELESRLEDIEEALEL